MSHKRLAIGTSMAAILAAGTRAGNAARGCPLTTGQVSELLHVRVHLYRPSADVLCMFAPPGTPKDQLQQSRPLVAVVPRFRIPTPARRGR